MELWDGMKGYTNLLLEGLKGRTLCLVDWWVASSGIEAKHAHEGTTEADAISGAYLKWRESQ
jgi:hypothetical protein